MAVPGLDPGIVPSIHVVRRIERPQARSRGEKLHVCRPLQWAARMANASSRRRGVDGRDNPRIKSGDGHDDGGSTRNGNEFAAARIARTGGHIPLATQNANACES